MDIYIIQPGDNINTIADKYGMTTERLISDNGLINPYALVPGQALVILHPKTTYIVKQGDTLASIAASNEITFLQLVRNNPFLYNREHIFPGEALTIEYSTLRDVQVNGFTYVFINRDILTRALPYLTYLSVYNYRIMEDAVIIDYGEDNEVIKLTKEYNTLPLLMISAFSPTGELNLESVYEYLLDNEMQDRLFQEMLRIIKQKGYYGINIMIGNLKDYNQNLYINSFTKLSRVLRNEGYYFMLTINTDYGETTDDVSAYENIDFNSISQLVDRITFLQNIWEKRKLPPAPISDISLIEPFIKQVASSVSSKKISIGKPLIGYDWTLPFAPNISSVYSLSLNSAITLAYEQRVTIQFDEQSQTPYYTYIKANVNGPENHIVWFIDARSIKALEEIIIDNNLIGTGLWNITSFNQQLFSVINVSFLITKFQL